MLFRSERDVNLNIVIHESDKWQTSFIPHLSVYFVLCSKCAVDAYIEESQGLDYTLSLHRGWLVLSDPRIIVVERPPCPCLDGFRSFAADCRFSCRCISTHLSYELVTVSEVFSLSQHMLSRMLWYSSAGKLYFLMKRTRLTTEFQK